MNLYEQYRPRAFDHVLGQDKAVRQIRAVLERGWGGRCYWIAGASGTGKTTLAKIIASQGADDFYVSEYDSADKVSVATVEQISENMCYSAPGKGGRAYIINEAHGLRKAVIRLLLGVLERLPRHVVVIFTTTRIAQEKLFEDQIDADPLLSRCIQVTLTNQGLAKVFAEHCKAIAEREGLDGKPLANYVRMVQDYHNNCRAALQHIESGLML